MTEQTHLIGKDATLETSIARMEQQLAQAGFDIAFAKAHCPVDGIFWLHIKDRHCPALFTNGKGASRKPPRPVR